MVERGEGFFSLLNRCIKNEQYQRSYFIELSSLLHFAARHSGYPCVRCNFRTKKKSKKLRHLSFLQETWHRICRIFRTNTARSVEDETRNAELSGNPNPECWGDLSKLQIQIQQKSHVEFVPRDTSEFKSNQNRNSTLYREIPRYLIFSIWTS